MAQLLFLLIGKFLMIKSIFSNKPAKKKLSISVQDIVEGYLREYNIDVSNYFIDKPFQFFLYESDDIGCLFFYPSGLSGDSDFYNKLSNYPWYFISEKWEYNQALKFINNSSNVLEIGCGNGSFLRKIKDSALNFFYTGIDLKLYNNFIDCELDEVKFIETDFNNFFKNNNNRKYDVVVAFQVLEHLEDLKEFFDKTYTLLNNDGLLILSVPNSDSLLFKFGFDLLNFPPHHLSRWNLSNFKRLEKFTNFKLYFHSFEPLEKMFYDRYSNSLIELIKDKCPFFLHMFNFFLRKGLIKVFFKKFKYLFRSHSILVVLKKI